METQTKPLSARWTHAEREVLVSQSDKLGRCDITGWARAISKPFGSVFKPIRPEVDFRREAFRPVKSLALIHPIIPSNGAIATCEDINCAGGDESVGPRALTKRTERNIKIVNTFATHYARTNHGGGVEITSITGSVELETIPADELAKWLASKRDAVIPRE